MVTDSDQRKMTAAILRGQECANSLKTIMSSDQTLVTHVDTILQSFSICLSLLNPHHESSSHRSNKKRKSSVEEVFKFHRDDSPIPILDGFSRRKYGQKNIKKSPFQRNYYRCSGSKCNGRKHVQKIQDSPPIFRSTYVGLHMCQAGVLHFANDSESSTMIQFEQAWNEDQVTDQVVNQEYGNDEDSLMKDDKFWVSDEFEMMFSYNHYDL